MNAIKASLFFLLLMFNSGLQANPAADLLSNKNENINSSNSLDLSTPLITEESESFLPVEQAYQLNVSHKPDSLLLDWAIADKYYLYGEQFRFEVNGQEITANLPTGIIAYDTIFEKDVEKHYGNALVTINKSALPSSYPYELKVVSQGCADAGLCYPPHHQKFTINESSVTPIIEVKTFAVNQQTKPSSNNTALPIKFELEKALAMLAFAIVGGMILNLMPCVLPVLSLKALSMANSQESHRAQGWSYTIGVISTFILIAVVLLIIRSAGQSIGWGFQLQSPSFVAILIYLFLVMGLSLSGFITIGSRWMGMGQSLTTGNGLKQSYFTGVLAAVVASPCTAPFMAPALGFAITQPWFVALIIFAGLGFGMALPLLLLSYLPQLNQWLPKPGAWMETFKQAMAFPLYLTAIWLLWVISRQLGSDATINIIIGALAIVFIFWLGKQTSSLSKLSGVLTLVLIAFMSWHIGQRSSVEKPIIASQWEPYNKERLTSLRQQGKAVFVNLTADWCITCKFNEKRVFTDATLEYMKNKDITLVMGDWTNYNSTITHLLEEYGRGGVPLYLLFPAAKEESAIILPQILSPESFKNTIDSI